MTEQRDEAAEIARALWTKALEVLSFGEPSAEEAYVSAQSAQIRALVDARLELAAVIIEGWHVKKGGYLNLAAEVLTLKMRDGR